mmetsp:Transcript_8161/g.15361  ORF Transcript_8161/g.15361 Transcript_8161/m.15361 type:complete len:432 (-) Transcript_8161:54-1349(-)
MNSGECKILPEPHPCLSFLEPDPPLKGQTLYLGGENGPDGRVYCIPGHSPRVLVIDPNTDKCTQIGPSFQGKFKWLRGICASNGIIYGLQCHASEILRIDARDAMEDLANIKISTIEVPYDCFFDDPEERETERNMIWKYHGGAISPIDGCIYCIPQSATRVLRIDPRTDECSFVGPKLQGKYKWYGGLPGRDGCVYGIPHNSGSVLRIAPKGARVDVTLHGDLGESAHQWHGAGTSSDGTIVCIPNNASKVLLICTSSQDEDDKEPTLEIVGGPDVVGTGSHAGREDRKYKYLGAVADEKSNVYCLPSGTERVLRINTKTREVDEIGPSLYESGLERIKQNKWQNGFYSAVDQCVYGIPLAAETVLKIDLKANNSYNGSQDRDPIVSTMGLPRDSNGGLAKWEGGVLASNGNMYCMPNNFKKVLKITPAR